MVELLLHLLELGHRTVYFGEWFTRALTVDLKGGVHVYLVLDPGRK